MPQRQVLEAGKTETVDQKQQQETHKQTQCNAFQQLTKFLTRTDHDL